MSHTDPIELLGSFPSDWEVVRLPEVIFIQEGPGITSDKFRKDGVPFLNIRCFLNGRIERASCQFVSNQLANGTYKHFQLAADDWVFSSSGTIGKVAIIYEDDLPLLLNTSTIRFRTNDKDRLENRYIKVFLQSSHFSKQHRLQTQGSAQVNVGPTHLQRMYIPLPPTIEQAKITEILSTVDRAIEQTEALIAKQQRIKTGLMQDLLTRGIDEHGNLRSPETHEFKDSPLGRIPMEWEVDTLRSHLSYLSYGFTNPMPTVMDGPYMVTAANISNGVIHYDGCRRTTREAYKQLLTKKSRPELGDILITKDGTLGRIALVDRQPLCINQSVAVLRPKDGTDNEFLKLLLESPACQESILADAGGSTIKHIYISKIDKMLITTPSDPEEQTVIKDRLQIHAKQLCEAEGQLEKLRSLKTALMQDLLTGEKRVTPLLDMAVTTTT